MRGRRGRRAGAGPRLRAAALVMVLAAVAGCARVQQWREARAQASASASASAAEAASYERVRSIVPDDVSVCDLMTAADMETILGQQLDKVTFSRHSYDQGKVAFQCVLGLVVVTPYESFPADFLEIDYGLLPRERPLLDEISANPDVGDVREVTADGLEGQGVAYSSSSAYYLNWHYLNDYEIRFYMVRSNTSAPPRDPTDEVLIPLLQAITGTAHEAASGPPHDDITYPPRASDRTTSASPTP